MTRKSLLVMLPIAPWPARANGVSIRYYPALKRLAALHDVDVLITSDPGAGDVDDELARTVRRVCVIPATTSAPSLRERARVALGILSPWGVPFEYASYTRREKMQALLEMVRQARYDTIHCVGCFERDALEEVREGLGSARITYDCVDSPSLHYARSPHPNWLSRKLAPFRAFDLWKTRRWERSLLRHVDASIYISSTDANGAGDNRVSEVVPNGIYDAAGAAAPSEHAAGAPTLGFLGNMSYRPNVVGALALYHDIYLPLKRQIPGLRLKIIGRDPAPEIANLAGEGVEVTGTVDDIWPHIHNVDVFAFPMTSGAGLQNKIIEVMYAGRPVVTTPICQQSVGAAPGTEILVGDDAAAVREGARELLSDRARAEAVASAGRAFVRRQFDVDEVVRRFERLLLPEA